MADADEPFTMTIEDVCRLAWDYHVIRTVSARELIARSGYRDRWRSITVGLLADTLAQHPACAVFVEHELASIAGVGLLPE